MRIRRLFTGALMATALAGGLAGASAGTASAAEPVEVQASAQSAKAANCGGRVVGYPGKWSPAVKGRCSFAGYPGAKKGYSWKVQSGQNTTACVKVLGFNSKNKPTWYNAGCGGSGKVTVSWGNNLATPKVKAISQTPHLALVAWSG
ncbi:hypothetical protein CDO52_15795 [Nocardiopsis gilva YIM 90087]|uniref:Secreted protein n=1 Tax=Nocardiopsis gilva YIM 90087 TaxID=1235441 RepID=A0A223S7G3_9ACTN|nr:hypothetical protein [Nocardiopsis gilva]ASU84058.1 hypothetical protein CDO52_15795 [Nocardiopsis gilva YIM 90087]